jgi:hypothetical protein
MVVPLPLMNPGAAVVFLILKECRCRFGQRGFLPMGNASHNTLPGQKRRAQLRRASSLPPVVPEQAARQLVSFGV